MLQPASRSGLPAQGILDRLFARPGSLVRRLADQIDDDASMVGAESARKNSEASLPARLNASSVEPQGPQRSWMEGNFPQRRQGLSTGSGTTGSSSALERYRLPEQGPASGGYERLQCPRMASISALPFPGSRLAPIATARNAWAPVAV